MSRFPIPALASLLIFTIPGTPLASASQFWHKEFGDDATIQYGYGVAVDASGAIVMGGSFRGTINLGGEDLVSAGGADIYIARFHADGTHQWSKRFGDANDQSLADVAVDAAGSVLITGDAEGSFSFGGSALTSAGSVDLYYAKFTSTGGHTFSAMRGSTAADLGSAIAADAAGNVYVHGIFTGTVSFGGTALISAGSTDLFLAKYNTGGVHLWSKRFGDAASQSASDLAVDASGNSVITGEFNGAVDFGLGTLTSAGGYDIYLARFNTSGTALWGKRFGDAALQYSHSVDINSVGHIVIGGQHDGTLNLGGSNLVSAGSDGYFGIFTNSGTHLASRRIGDASGQRVYAVCFGSDSQVFVTGITGGSPDFGGVVLSGGGGDMFVARYNLSAALSWVERLGGDNNGRSPHAITSDPAGNPVVTGHFIGVMPFDVDPLYAVAYDAFLAVFGANPVEPDIRTIFDVANDQGRALRIHFTGSGQDNRMGAPPVTHYEAYRRNTAVPSASARLTAAEAWEFVASVPAHEEPEYYITVPTLADSTADFGVYRTSFVIRAATSDIGLFWDSPPDSGVSADNLAPGVPQSLALGGGVLTWAKPADPDFDYFSVYGSSSATFDGSAKLIANTTLPQRRVDNAPYEHYFVTATDFSGNTSAAGSVRTSTGAGPQSYVLSVSAFPNPFNPSTTIRYDVPSAGRVTVSVYDARGILVRTLVDATREAGSFSEGWDGLDARGSTVGSGVYFARVTFAGKTVSRKLVLLK